MEPARKRLGRHANRRRPRELPAEEGLAARPPARLVLHDVKQPAARQPVLAFASAAALAAVTVALAAPRARLPRRRCPDHITIAARFVASNVLPRLSTRGSTLSAGPRSRINTWSSRPLIVSGSRFDRFGSGEVHELAYADPKRPANLRHA